MPSGPWVTAPGRRPCQLTWVIRPEAPTSRFERSLPTVMFVVWYQPARGTDGYVGVAVCGGASERMKRSPSKRSREVTRRSRGAWLARALNRIGPCEEDCFVGP